MEFGRGGGGGVQLHVLHGCKATCYSSNASYPKNRRLLLPFREEKIEAQRNSVDCPR